MSGITCFPQLRYATILPSGGKTLKTQLIDCYKQLKENTLVYVREEADIPSVAKIISETHNNCPCLIMQSDICRSNLMVEIEGVIEFGY